MPIVGSKPKNGVYKCIICDQRVTIDHSRPTLTFCPKCDGISFISTESNLNM